jgi:hypothetical protein
MNATQDLSRMLANLPRSVATVDREDDVVSYFATEAEASHFARDWPAKNSRPKQSERSGYSGLWYVCSTK